MAARQKLVKGWPNAQGSCASVPSALWLRKNGKTAPSCVKRTNSSPVASPQKPPVSKPTKGTPESPRASHIRAASPKCPPPPTSPPPQPPPPPPPPPHPPPAP